MSQPVTPNYQPSGTAGPPYSPVETSQPDVIPPPYYAKSQQPVEMLPATSPAPQFLAPAPQAGSIGRIRGTGLAIFLCIITLGIYSLVWTYQVHDEMKRHSGQGVGGGVGLLIAFFVGIVSPFIVSAEVGQLYQQRGLQRPVSGATGLWCVLGIFILIGPIVWFVKTNSALNAYWRSLGAQ